MTTVNVTLQVCDDTGLPSLQLVCSGINCESLAKNWTCTQNQASWTCTNGISCASSSNNFSTNFTLAQNNITFNAKQLVFSHGYSYNVFEDPSGNVTITNQTGSSTTVGSTTATATRSSASRHGVASPLSCWTILSLFFLCVMLAVAPVVADCYINTFSSLAQMSNAFIESVETGSWGPIQKEWCIQTETEALSILPYYEKLEQQLLLSCLEKMLVGELVVAAGLLGGTVEVELPLGDAAVARVLGVEAAPEMLSLGILALASCPMLTDCFVEQLRQGQASAICDTTSSSTTVSSSTTTTSSSQSTSSAPGSRPTSNPSGQLVIPSVAGDNCASCQLSLYALGIVGLAEKCNVAVPLGVAFDVSVLLCDSSFNGKYATFCKTLCANQCVTYNINDWIQSAGSSYMSSANLGGCSSYCPGFKGDGRCEAADPCGCAVGADTCVPCF